MAGKLRTATENIQKLSSQANKGLEALEITLQSMDACVKMATQRAKAVCQDQADYTT